MNNELQILKTLNNKAANIALRWVKSWDKYCGYNNVGAVYIDFTIDKIEFVAIPISSGIGFKQYIDIKYLEDDSTLESDGKNWYDNYIKERNDLYKRITELENTPQVLEYLRLKNQNNYNPNNFLQYNFN